MDNSSQTLNLKSLNTKIANAIIVGIIIRTQNIRTFASKKDEGERGVWNFTLRDSITDYINVTCWGSSAYINLLVKKFCVGDVVSLLHPKISIRQIDDAGEQYRPAVTSPFTLTLNEANSNISIYDSDNYHQFLPLLHYPTKPADSHLTLADVYNNGGTIRGEYIDLMVAVRSVTPIRILTAKADGREMRKRDVIILDQTNDGLRVALWDSEFIDRAEQWKSRETILFMTDMRVDWSNFERSMTANLTSRSIITEDPLVPQAEELRKYARTVPFAATAIIDQMVAQIPDPTAIRAVMTVQRVIQLAFASKQEAGPSTAEQNQFTALIYGFISSYDLDGFSNVIITRCGRCNRKIEEPVNMCINLECPVGSGAELASPETKFDLIVDLSDHTGTLKCRLAGKVAENVIGKTVEEFSQLTSFEKETLKWKYLMERCAVRLIIMKRDRRAPLVSIVACELAKSTEVSTLLSIY